MSRWEAELQSSFPFKDWIAASQSSSKLSRCINHREIMRKIHLRWYMTPVRFRHIKADASQFCWRKCGNIGTQLHMWWLCPITTVFWQKIETLASEVLQYSIVLNPELAILDIHLLSHPRNIRTVLHHILLAARFVIAQHWNSAHPLSLPEVINRINTQCHNEMKLIYSPIQSIPQHVLWEPWTSSKYFV